MDKTADPPVTENRHDRLDRLMAEMHESLARFRRNTDAIFAECRADIARQRGQQK